MSLHYTPRFDFRRPPATAGECRWCRRVDGAWVNRRHTLCADCEDFDRLLRTRAGRESLIALWHAAQPKLHFDNATSGATD